MKFELFSGLHFLHLFGYTAVFVLLYFWVANSKNPRKPMIIISIISLIAKGSDIFYRHFHNGEAFKDTLPLHLCNIVIILAALGYILNSKNILKITFYWSLGALFALITPEVKECFPSVLNISFFETHVYILFTSIVSYRIFNVRPTFKNWISCWLVLNVYAAIIFQVNKILNTNYLYINHVPEFKSPISLLGPWPYYIIPVEGLYLVLTLILVLLFRDKNKR